MIEITRNEYESVVIRCPVCLKSNFRPIFTENYFECGPTVRLICNSKKCKEVILALKEMDFGLRGEIKEHEEFLRSQQKLEKKANK